MVIIIGSQKMLLRTFQNIDLKLEDKYVVYKDEKFLTEFDFIDDALNYFSSVVIAKKINMENNGISVDQRELAEALYGV